MRSLFLKIFLSFWLAMVLVSGTLIYSVVTTQSEFTLSRAEQSDRTLIPIVAARAADLLDDHGMGALADYLTSLETTLNWHAFLFDDEGKEILSQPAPPEVAAIAQRALQASDTVFSVSRGIKYVARRTTGATGTRYVFVTAVKVESVASILRAPLGIQILRGAAILLIAGLVCFWLARYITAPIRHLRTATHRLAMGNLSARVGGYDEGRKDELTDLSRDFDHMAEQIESLLKSQRRLISDISHELRSPLTRLCVALGLARRHAGPEFSSALDRIDLESERLNHLIGSLLELARLESGAEVLEGEPLELESLVRDVAADADYEAQSRNRHVRVLAADSCTIIGDEQLVRAATENVIRNALSHTGERTDVDVTLQVEARSSGQAALIRVRDRGKGVPEESLADIFLPFYRVGDARERSAGGSGLGLSITDRAVRLHGGSVKAENCADGGGLVVELRFPVSARAKGTVKTPTAVGSLS
jgi:two-component system sensor histidine kinase CpxA